METVNLLNGNHWTICKLQEIYRERNKNIVIGYPLSKPVYEYLLKTFDLSDYVFYNIDSGSDLDFAIPVKENDSITNAVESIVNLVKG